MRLPWAQGAQALPPAEDSSASLVVQQYNVVWNTASKDSHGSMPLGNGDIGINAWVEPSGDLVFYVSKTDAWDENGRLCKIGRVRVTFDPPLPVARSFRHELRLREGVMEIRAGQSRLELWVDANQPVVRLLAESHSPVSCRTAVELWRLRERPFGPEDDSHSGSGLETSAFRSTLLPDTLVTAKQPQVVWYHRNTRSIYSLCLKTQHLESLEKQFVDPLLNCTFGAALGGTDCVRDGARAIVSRAPAKRHELSVTVLSARTDTPDEWLKRLDALQRKIAGAAPEEARRAHEAWWHGFWDRSWVSVEGGDSFLLPASQQPWRVGIASDGGSRFRGAIVGPRVIGRAWSSDEIAELARQPRTEETALRQEPVGKGCTAVAWIKPAEGESGRILDKCTAGSPDGITFDTHPGLSLRWIVGSYTITAERCLAPGQWQHVAATVDAASGARRIFLNGKLVKEERAEPAYVILTRGYMLQRFVSAGGGRGGSPIKFNGSIFTVEAEPGASPETPPGDPDWRQWGSNYWFQNTRLIYWPMLAAGDFDMLDPWFHMCRHALPLGQARIKSYYGFDGAAQFPETMYWWGLPNNGDYGWSNTAPEPANGYIRRYWSGSLELIAVMLDRYEYTQDEQFARETLVPLADPLIRFFDSYWSRRDAEGKIRFEPAQSLETWHVATNPMPEIAGLRFLIPRLLDLPAGAATAEQRGRWRKMFNELPPVPVAAVDGVKLLRPAEIFSPNRSNAENPELYAVFPYRLYGVGRSGLDLARATFAGRANRLNCGWCQDSIHAACLGLGDEAGKLVAARAAQVNRSYRFPAMWGPNFDWVPDQDHGNNILTTLHCMLLQSEGEKLYVLPAWPKDWSVSFKLHAPHQTTVQCVYRAGRFEKLAVSPKSREEDVVLPAP